MLLPIRRFCGSGGRVVEGSAVARPGRVLLFVTNRRSFDSVPACLANAASQKERAGTARRMTIVIKRKGLAINGHVARTDLAPTYSDSHTRRKSGYRFVDSCRTGFISGESASAVAWRDYNLTMFRMNLAGWRLVVALAIAVSSHTAAAQAADSQLQSAVSRAMADRRGTAVVLDVHTGRVIASSHLAVAARRVVTPGSSIKPFTLMALLESGKINAQTALMCKRSVAIAGHKLDCSHPQTSEPLDPATALAYSCNSYFTTVALRLSPSQLRDSFLRGGFGSPTSLASDEAAGTVALAGSPQQLQLQAIGEWGIRVTPLELAKAYRNIALARSKHEPTLEPLFVGLQESVAYGMGHAAQPAASMKVAGKTGTAPAEEGSWTHAWFAGYAPAANPEIVLVVFLEKGHGGNEAAWVAKQIFASFADDHVANTAAKGAER